MKKSPLSEEQSAECTALKNIFLSKKKQLGLTQEKAGVQLKISAAGVNHYLNGVNALNLPIAVAFARLLDVAVSDFSPRLARELSGVSADGDGQSGDTKVGNSRTSKGGLSVYDVPVTLVPLVDWEAVEAWCTSANAGSTEKYMPCPDQLGPRGFATIVEGDAMRNPNAHEDSYPNKTVIYVDPDVKASVGDPVLVLQNGSGVPIFRVFTRDAGRDILKPLNPQYPIIPLGDGDQFMGVICGYYRRPSSP